jgi:hypothetical protein
MSLRLEMALPRARKPCGQGAQPQADARHLDSRMHALQPRRERSQLGARCLDPGLHREREALLELVEALRLLGHAAARMRLLQSRGEMLVLLRCVRELTLHGEQQPL